MDPVIYILDTNVIAALAQRLNAVVVTSDNDFAALPVQREDWRESQ